MNVRRTYQKKRQKRIENFLARNKRLVFKSLAFVERIASRAVPLDIAQVIHCKSDSNNNNNNLGHLTCQVFVYSINVQKYMYCILWIGWRLGVVFVPWLKLIRFSVKFGTRCTEYKTQCVRILFRYTLYYSTVRVQFSNGVIILYNAG